MLEPLPPVRARVGLIVPSSNRLSEPQFQRFLPAGVQLHVTRLRMTGQHSVPLDELMGRIEEAALTLADAKCDVIVFHCTGSAMADGLAAERRVIDAIGRVTERRATTTASAILEAFRALGARKLVMVSPYVQATNDDEIDFLRQAGLTVLRDRAADVGGSDMYVATPPSFWLEATRELAHPEADAYFLSCTNIHSLDVIEDLERELDRPVVTSNQATLWYCLRLLGLPDAVPGLGWLMRLGLPAAAATSA
jgi:maleate isomerase